jgi:hypothetical protein
MRGSRMPWLRVLATGAAAALLLGGCVQILGEVELEPPPPVTVPPQEMRPIECAQGETRCDGAAYLECKQNRTGWSTRALCASAALCAQGVGCAEPTCLPNELRCSDIDPRLLQQCNDDLTGWITVDTCESAGQCNASAGSCTEPPCTPGELQCSGRNLESCNSTASSWTLSSVCLTSAQCDPARSSCAPLTTTCQAAARACAAGYAQRCALSRDGFIDAEACVNAANCIPSQGCTRPACTPGSYRCNGASLEQCDLNRFWDEVDVCAGPAYCDASLKSCTITPCAPGSRQCSGAAWLQCSAQGEWTQVDECEATSLCDVDEGCKLPTCDLGDYRCTGQTLERCSINQNAWLQVQQCQNAALCNASAKRCDWPRCEPGSFRCDLQGNLTRCSDDGVAYQAVQACGSAAACDVTGGRCTPLDAPVACATDTLRCNGQWLERCRGTPGVWRAESRCLSATLCDVVAGTCQEPACAPGEYRCSETPDPVTGGTPLEVCSPGRDRFVLAELCQPEQTCDAVHGQCDRCPSLTQGCDGNNRGLCSNDGQEFEVDEVCATGCTVVTNGAQTSARCEGS